MATLAPSPARRPLRRRILGFLYRQPRLQLALLLSAPLGWLLVAYLGSLAVLFFNATWSVDSFTGNVVHAHSLSDAWHNLRSNFGEIFTGSGGVYRTVALRTLEVAAAVTAFDAVLAMPIAFYMAKVASPKVRGALFVAVTMPLWTSYLIKAYAWRIMLATGGPIDWALHPFGLSGPGVSVVSVWLVLSYLWLPYMILPLYAGLERIPNSLVEASSDLGAHAGRTFRSVILPIAVPALVAGSIFTFSLSLGDYITVGLVS